MTVEPQSLTADVRLVLTRLIDAPVDLVWEVWTKAEHLAHWWGPEGFGAKEPELELRIGGAISIMLTAPDGSTHPARGTFTEIIEYEKLVIDAAPQAQDGCGAGLPPGARVTVRFKDEGGKTKLTLDTEFPSAAARQAAIDEHFRQGWETSFTRLETFVQKR